MPGQTAGPSFREGAAPEALGTESVTTTNTAGRSWRAYAILFILALASTGLVSGCDILVTDRTPPSPASSAPPRPSNVSQAPSTQEFHDLAVAAVDFDPALDSRQIMRDSPQALLVAVENKGNRQEGPFTVTVQFLTQDRRQVLMSAERTLNMLASGDLTVVRFRGEAVPPAHRAYILNAQVQAVPRETNTANNRRTLEIQVNTAGDSRVP